MTYYDQIKDYFSIDPMILKLFAFLAPKEDFAALCKRVPPFLSTEILTQRALLKVDPEVTANYVLDEVLTNYYNNYPG